jgi:phage terminase large subunit-like protein
VSVLVVPSLEKKPWPSLGGQVCDWIEANLVFGPGDLRGQPARIDDEKRGLIYRMYEVWPKGTPNAGRRRFRRVALSLRKGSAKTELAAWIAAAELHPAAPVRCIDFDKKGHPRGGPVIDPYIPLVAYTEEQSEDLAYGALRIILELSQVSEDFDIGLERIMRIGGDGKAVALASAPDARDGARTTFQHFDETHRFTLPRLKQAHRTMLANLPKRRIADPWSLETTTAPAPGEQSVAEDTMEYARAVAEGRSSDARLFFFHRQASDEIDISTPRGLKRAVLEASGPVAGWSDVAGIMEQFDDPTADRNFLERVWLNRPKRSQDRAFDINKWAALATPGYVIPDEAWVTVGFDGARRRDSTAIVITEIQTGSQMLWGLWEQPHGVEGDGWEVPEEAVSSRMAEAFKTFNVWKLYADPPYWETTVDRWAGEFTQERVIEWSTNRDNHMAPAVRAFNNAIQDGELSHDGSPRFARHIGNCFRRVVNVRNDKGEWEPYWVVYKERKNSPNKIDAAVAAILSWRARLDALSEGIGRADAGSIYDDETARPEGMSL